MWRKGNHQWQVEVEIPATTLFATAENTIEDPKQLEYPLLATAVPGCGMLDCKWVDATIVPSHFQSTVADTVASNHVDLGQEAIDPNKVLVVVPVRKILPGDLDIVKLLELELAQMRTV